MGRMDLKDEVEALKAIPGIKQGEGERQEEIGAAPQLLLRGRERAERRPERIDVR